MSLIENKQEHTKPKLTVSEQIKHLRRKGVTFNSCDTDRAAWELTYRDSFLHLTAYRALFQKYESGEKAGQYIRLDFSNLLDLDALDAEIRSVFLQVSLDVEHLAKQKIKRMITDNEAEDGYSIVSDFMSSLAKGYRKKIEHELSIRSNEENIERDEYAGNLIGKYLEDMPAWVLLEILSFGSFLSFYKFCSERWDDTELSLEYFMLKDVKAIRNACAHRSCIINGFCNSVKTDYDTSPLVTTWLTNHGIANSKSRRAKLGNRRIQQIACAIVSLDHYPESRKVCCNSFDRLFFLKDSINARLEEYSVDNACVSYLAFLVKMIDGISAEMQ